MHTRITIHASFCCTLTLLALAGCDTSESEPSSLEFEDDDGVAERLDPASDALTTSRHTPAFPGFGVDIAVAGDDIVLDWSAAGPQGSDVRVFRSTDADALADSAALPNPNAEEIVLPTGATSFVDVGAADHGQSTPNHFYRLVVDGAASTMLMKRSTAMAPGYNKLGMCMIDGPSHASDIAAQLGASVAAVWTWDGVSQSYLGWTPAQGTGSAADYEVPFGSVVAAQVDASTPAFQTLVGTVPTDEAAAVSGEPGYNWSVFPAR